MSRGRPGSGRRRRTLGVLFVLVALGLAFLLVGKDELDQLLERLPRPSGSSAQGQDRDRDTDRPDETGTRLRGRVTYADGSPADGAALGVRSRDGTGVERRFETSAGPGGSFSVEPVRDAQGHPFDVVGVDAHVGPLSVAVSGAALKRLQGGGLSAKLVLPGAFRLAGLVQDRASRGPMAGARLACAGLTVTVSADGTFEFPAIPVTPPFEGVAIVATADGYARTVWEVPADRPPGWYGDVLIRMEKSP